MKVNSCDTALASSTNLSDAHEQDSDELNTIMKESPRRYTNPFLSDQENDQLNLWNINQEHENSINEENFTNNVDDENSKKAKEMYIDKNVTEFKPCYEENGFHVVKDICVDNGLSHDEKIEIDKKHHELSCEHDNITDTDTVDGDKHDDASEDCHKNTDLCSVTQDKPDSDIPISKNSNEDITEGNIDIDVISSQSSSQGKDSTTECGDHPKVEIVCEDDNGPANYISNDLKSFVESDIIQPTENSIHEFLQDTQSAPNQETASDNFMAAKLLQRGDGESSFSMAGPISGRIAYSGSISHRSDSSNTSIRSFAFPILQTEYNMSPVRMVKVDQTRSRKHRRWREALMCCKF